MECANVAEPSATRVGKKFETRLPRTALMTRMGPYICAIRVIREICGNLRRLPRIALMTRMASFVAISLMSLSCPWLLLEFVLQ